MAFQPLTKHTDEVSKDFAKLDFVHGPRGRMDVE